MRDEDLVGPFHNGGTEGVNTKTKLIKRQMYERAGFILLRYRTCSANQHRPSPPNVRQSRWRETGPTRQPRLQPLWAEHLGPSTVWPGERSSTGTSAGGSIQGWFGRDLDSAGASSRLRAFPEVLPPDGNRHNHQFDRMGERENRCGPQNAT
ncbi:hypothetical protein ACFP2T_43075 [Plantactinospora solaniradicis]|uniref:Transposase IS204/IS1001/IS1096/IS1165 DDE domain-containing protein n=1 Tax=Plantactinospora solaniradicis TaxID=1723736 RepID=A0ABW1KM91_9ACTN